jgi:hypothetical protein
MLSEMKLQWRLDLPLGVRDFGVHPGDNTILALQDHPAAGLDREAAPTPKG